MASGPWRLLPAAERRYGSLIAMPRLSRRRARTALTPRLWSLWAALPLAVAFAVIAATALFYGVLHLLNLQLPPGIVTSGRMSLRWSRPLLVWLPVSVP
jgi:hypothetical protein